MTSFSFFKKPEPSKRQPPFLQPVISLATATTHNSNASIIPSSFFFINNAWTTSPINGRLYQTNEMISTLENSFWLNCYLKINTKHWQSLPGWISANLSLKKGHLRWARIHIIQFEFKLVSNANKVNRNTNK